MRLTATVLPMLLLSAAPASAQNPPAAAPDPQMSAAECEVWARELGFARSVAEHDPAGFAEHLHPDAAFGSGRVVPTRGRDAIVREWRGIIEGERGEVHWYPTRTTIAGVDGIAWSSGPALFEDRRPEATARYHLGAFHSVWHRGEDGVWRVLFDDGVVPRPASEAEVAAFHAGRRATCPQA